MRIHCGILFATVVTYVLSCCYITGNIGTSDLNKCVHQSLGLCTNQEYSCCYLHKYILTSDWLLNKENNPEFKLSVANTMVFG